MERWQIALIYGILWAAMLLSCYIWIKLTSNIKIDFKGVQPQIEVFGRKYKKKNPNKIVRALKNILNKIITQKGV